MTDFGNRLKQARKEKHMTQKELAKRLGLEQSAISNYEKSFRTPPMQSILDIAEALKVSVSYLLGETLEGNRENLGKPQDSGTSDDVADLDLTDIQNRFLEDLIAGHYDVAFERINHLQTYPIRLLDLYKYIFEPTLVAIGLLWEVGKISIAEEHIISDLISRTLVAFSEQEHKNTTPTKPFTAAFMLPGSELHDFSLKMTLEVFKQMGWQTFYIGKSVPTFSLETFFSSKSIDVLVLSVTLKEHLNSCEALIKAIREMSISKQPVIIVGGSALENQSDMKSFLGSDIVLTSLDDLEASIIELEKNLENQ